ncbi:MAG: type II toxin-antitoxin system RelE/ParE family toxin [Thermoanaerobaculia bacterium]
MTAQLPLRITPRASRQIREASTWWDLNRRAAPDAFREALESAFELISTQPNIGALATNVRSPGTRRIHLSRVRYYLYYRIRNNPAAVEVLAIWHTSRYPDPRL